MIGFSKSLMGGITPRWLVRDRQSFVKSGRAQLDTDYVDKDTPGFTIINKVMKDGVSYDFMKQAYDTNPWITAIVNKTIARVCQVDIYPKPVDFGSDAPKAASKKQKKRMEKIQILFNMPNDQLETFDSLKSKILKDILLYDTAGMEVIQTGTEQFELYCNCSGRELFINVDKNGKFVSDDKAYIQVKSSPRKIVANWGKYEMMFFSKNRTSGRMRGFSPIESLALSVSADLFADKYNVDFFSNNARPNIAFLFENLGFGKGNTAIRRAKEWYLQEHQGKPHQPLFMGAEKGAVKLQTLQLTNKDMEFKEYQMSLLSKIMAVYGMQPFVLGIITDTTGKLNSEEQTNQFKIDAVIPYLNVIMNAMNLVLIWNENNFGYKDIYLIHDDLDLKDMLKTAEMYDTYLKNGVITINQVRQELKMAPVPWGDIPYIPVNIAPLGGAAPDRMEQNPAAASAPKPPDYGKPNKSLTKDDVVDRYNKNRAGLQYVYDVNIIDAIEKIIKSRDKEIGKTFIYGNNGESEIDFTSLGKIGKKCSW